MTKYFPSIWRCPGLVDVLVKGDDLGFAGGCHLLSSQYNLSQVSFSLFSLAFGCNQGMYMYIEICHNVKNLGPYTCMF